MELPVFEGFGPRRLRWFAGSRARQHEGVLHRHPRALRDARARRPGGAARGAGASVRRRATVFRQQRDLRFRRQDAVQDPPSGCSGRAGRRGAGSTRELSAPRPVRRHGLLPARPRPARALPRRRGGRRRRAAAGRRPPPRRTPGSSSRGRACAPRRAATRATTADRAAAPQGADRGPRAGRSTGGIGATPRSVTSPARGAPRQPLNALARRPRRPERAPARSAPLRYGQPNAGPGDDSVAGPPAGRHPAEAFLPLPKLRGPA